jgi:phage/plasmid-associated DNA primase
MLYASGLDPEPAQRWLRTRFEAIDDNLVVRVTHDGQTKLKDELLARLHTWWSDRTMCMPAESEERKDSLWFYRLRKLVRDFLGVDQYKAMGLMQLEKKLKQISRQVHRSKEAAHAAIAKRAFHDVFIELSGETENSEQSDELYPIECNASAIKAILDCLEPSSIIQHAKTLKFISKHLGFLDRVQQKLILDADDVDESELEGAFRLTTKARCVIRLKELLSDQLSELDYTHWWSSHLHCFCRTRERFAVLQGLPGLAELYIHRARLEQTIKVVNDHGDCYLWDEAQRIWSKSDSSQLECAFLKFCSRIVSTEEGSLHIESIKSVIKRTQRNGEEEVINDPMLATMLKNAHKHSTKLNDGNFSSSFRKLLIVGLRDHRFEAEIDTDAPDFFPIRGGLLLDLRTGEVRPRVSTDKFSFESPAGFRRRLNDYRNAETFLLRICGGVPKEEEGLTGAPTADKQRRARDMLKSLQIHLGYLLTGQASEKNILQHYGITNTGKSTLWNLLKRMLSKFHAVISPALITAMAKPRNGHEHSAGFEPLFGARVVTCEEVPADTYINEALLKLMSSGGLDHMPVRGCGARETRTLSLMFKLVLVLNEMVKFAENADPATVKRARIYSYQTQHDPKSKESQAVVELVKTQDFLDELFTYLVEGSITWYKTGTPSCEIVAEATQEFQHAESPFDAYLSERCTCTKSTDPESYPLYIFKDDLMTNCGLWYAEKAQEGFSGYQVGKVWPKKHDLKRLATARGFVEKQEKDNAGTKRYCFYGVREMSKAELEVLEAAQTLSESAAALATVAAVSPPMATESDISTKRVGGVVMIESLEMFG